VTGIGIFSTIYLTPLFLEYVRGYSAWQIGLAIVSTGAASLVGIPVYVLLARKFDTRWRMTFGLALFGVSMRAYSYITSDWSGGELLIPQILRGFPQVFAVAPAVNLGGRPASSLAAASTPLPPLLAFRSARRLPGRLLNNMVDWWHSAPGWAPFRAGRSV
jgi:MFS family permease